MTDINPLIPAEYDLIWTVATVGVFAAIVVGIVLAIRFLAKRR